MRQAKHMAVYWYPRVPTRAGASPIATIIRKHCMDVSRIQSYLRDQGFDGWLLYNFRDLNPIAISVAGLDSGGSRRWFLWIPAQGAPRWLVHGIEGHMFNQADETLQGERLRYVSWQEMASMLPKLLALDGKRAPKIVMEYSP